MMGWLKHKFMLLNLKQDLTHLTSIILCHDHTSCIVSMEQGRSLIMHDVNMFCFETMIMRTCWHHFGVSFFIVERLQ